MLAHARLDGADLRDADLERANLHQATGEGARLERANLRGASEDAPPAPAGARRDP